MILTDPFVYISASDKYVRKITKDIVYYFNRIDIGEAD
jgi:hypothetical protein